MSSHPSLANLSALAPHVLAAASLVAMMLQLGLEPEPVADRAAKRRQRRLIGRALLFNFVVVPALAYAVARVLGAVGPVAVALLLLAASPGGRYAPALVKLVRGDVALSAEITIFTCKLNSIVSPLLAAWMIGVKHVGVHELKYVIQLLALQIVPYYGARQLRKRWPRGASLLLRPAGVTATSAALLLLVYLVAHHELRTAMLLGAAGWLAAILFGVVLLALGWLVGGAGHEVRRAFAITAEARNLALALVIANVIVGRPEVLLAIFGVWLILLGLGGAVALLGRLHHPLGATPAPQL